MNEDGGNTTGTTTTVMATTSPTSRECNWEERGEARRRMEDEPKRWQRRGGDEQGWRQCDGNDDNGDGDYKPTVKRVQEGGERRGQDEDGGQTEITANKRRR